MTATTTYATTAPESRAVMSNAPPAPHRVVRDGRDHLTGRELPADGRPRASRVVRDDLSQPERGLQPVEDREAVAHDPGRRLRRPEPEQHERPEGERRVVVLDDAVLDRPPDREWHERLRKHPDDPEEHTREQRPDLVPPDPEKEPRRRSRVRSPGVADGQADAAVADPAARRSEGCGRGLVHALWREGIPPSDRNQTLFRRSC